MTIAYFLDGAVYCPPQPCYNFFFSQLTIEACKRKEEETVKEALGKSYKKKKRQNESIDEGNRKKYSKWCQRRLKMDKAENMPKYF